MLLKIGCVNFCIVFSCTSPINFSGFRIRESLKVNVCYFFRVGIEIPTIEVRYERLIIDFEAYSASSSLPTFIHFYMKIVEVIVSLRISVSCHVHSCNGVLWDHDTVCTITLLHTFMFWNVNFLFETFILVYCCDFEDVGWVVKENIKPVHDINIYMKVNNEVLF